MYKQIFFGAGEHSMAQAYELHKKLERAFSLMSGLQQPPHHVEFGDFSGIEIDRFAEAEVELIAAEIYEKLTGRTLPLPQNVELESRDE